MPLRSKTLGAAIESVPKPAPSTLDTRRSVPVYEPPAEDDFRYSEFSYAFNSYKSDMSGMIDRFTELSGDVDIHQALVTIRNAERAIEARAKEILGG